MAGEWKELCQRKSNPFGLLLGEQKSRKTTVPVLEECQGGRGQSVMVHATWEEFQFKVEECRLNYMY